MSDKKRQDKRKTRDLSFLLSLITYHSSLFQCVRGDGVAGEAPAAVALKEREGLHAGGALEGRLVGDDERVAPEGAGGVVFFGAGVERAALDAAQARADALQAVAALVRRGGGAPLVGR